MTKQSEALHIAVANAKAVKAVGLANGSDEILLALYALCEEQKRLLEQARNAMADELKPLCMCFHCDGSCNTGAPSIEDVHTAITNHLRQQEVEKHD